MSSSDVSEGARQIPPYEEVLRPVMRDAARVARLGLPGIKHEEWRFVRLKHLSATDYQQARTPLDEARREALGALLTAREVSEATGRRLVIVDGSYDASLSDLSGVSEGASVSVLPYEDRGAGKLGTLSALIQDGADYFTALNDESWQEVVRVSVKGDHVLEPLHVIFARTDSSRSVSVPRLMLELAPGAKATLIEEHVALEAGEGALSIPVVELALAPSSHLTHVKVQELSLEDDQVARAAILLQEGAHYASSTFHLGAKLSRQDLHAEIAGGNTTCELHGLALLFGNQVSDTHSVMNHVHPDAHSDQVHKCVVGDKARAVFNGKIFVRQDAQRIDAFQLNRNLLLSRQAQVDTKPQLEIFADDVKCSHGATIGQLDEEQLFYLQARGIDAEAARGVLTYAFAAEQVERIPLPSLRARLEATILEKTRQHR